MEIEKEKRDKRFQCEKRLVKIMNIYVKCERKVNCPVEEVYLKDIGQVYCEQETIRERLENLCVYRFGEEKQKVINVLQIAEQITGKCPVANIHFLGEEDILLERERTANGSKLIDVLKIIFVCLISFFGTAFTIMAYHNDIGINGVFANIYLVCTGSIPSGLNALQISYSIGLAVGIILFFNHIGGKKLTVDPTPIEVAMNNYEKDVDMTVIEKENRK